MNIPSNSNRPPPPPPKSLIIVISHFLNDVAEWASDCSVIKLQIHYAQRHNIMLLHPLAIVTRECKTLRSHESAETLECIFTHYTDNPCLRAQGNLGYSQ